MRYFFCSALALAMLAATLGAAATTPATKTTKKKTSSSAKKYAPRHTVAATNKAPHKSTSAARPHVASSTTASSTHSKAPVHSTTWRNRQTSPSPDRYKEIQEALAGKGYLQPGQATGQWDQNSADALKKFQTEQNITASGKINSLSLIALGLGAKHENMPPKGDAAPADKPQLGPNDPGR